MSRRRTLTVRMLPKTSSATVLASAEAASPSRVYRLFRLLYTRRAARSRGRMARVRRVSSTEVVNMKTSPSTATTVERRATLMEIVPAVFISRVSCRGAVILMSIQKIFLEEAKLRI